MTAGPSEVTIICDKFSNPEWVASDLIGQAEHDNLAQCILISKDKQLIEKVKIEISKQLKEIPRQSVAMDRNFNCHIWIKYWCNIFVYVW